MMKSIVAAAARRGALALVVLGLVACASSTSSTWRSTYTGAPFKKVMVVGISENAEARKAFEEAFSSALRERGTTAFPSYQALSDEGPIAIERIRKAVDANQPDAVLVARVKGVEKTVKEGMTEMPGFPGWYSTAWSGVPASASVEERVVIESTFWDAKSDKALWRGETRELKNQSVQEAVKDLSRQLIALLKNGGLI